MLFPRFRFGVAPSVLPRFGAWEEQSRVGNRVAFRALLGSRSMHCVCLLPIRLIGCRRSVKAQPCNGLELGLGILFDVVQLSPSMSAKASQTSGKFRFLNELRGVSERYAPQNLLETGFL